MTKKFKLPGWVWVPLLIPLLIGLYFAENIKGQVRFMQYCWREGGLKVYEPLERDVGWWAENLDSAKSVAYRHPVAFVRFTESEGDGKEYDVRYTGGGFRNDGSYDVSPADHAKPVRYQMKFSIDKVRGELRLSEQKYEFYSLKDNTLLAGHYIFRYSQFDQNNSLLGAPSNVHCHSKDSPWSKKMNESFIGN